MPTLIFFFTLLTLLFLPPHVLTLTQKCHPTDKNALLQINKALNNAFSSWDPATDCCHWYGIKCDRITHRITQLYLTANPNLPGHIPDAISDLPYLEFLMFHKLNFTGTIPESITKLKHLTFLDFSWNHLSGPIPSFLNRLKNLNFLDLSFNDFTGTIPPSLSELPNLGGLRLDRNKLTGTIPDSFGKFTGKLMNLYLSHNMLTGEVPRSLGSLNFTLLDFSRNQLEGDVSFLFGANKSIEVVDFSRNLLEFNLSRVEIPDSLTSLNLNHNKIFGGLPERLARERVYYLNVSYNRLCGEIPTGGQLQRMDITSYFHNRCLCGAPLPACK